jgi:hypothetical protein
MCAVSDFEFVLPSGKFFFLAACVVYLCSSGVFHSVRLHCELLCF